MTLCPACGKRLLSQASACCNWCGASISDPEYQAQAQAERAAYYAHTAAHDAQSLAAMDALLLTNPMATDPWLLAPMPNRRSHVPGKVIVSTGEEGTSPHMPARGTDASKTEQAKAEQAKAEDAPIKSEAEEAGERFRHLEL